MRVKPKAHKAVQFPIKVVLVVENGIHVTHIYRSREAFRMDELACYRRKAFKAMQEQPVFPVRRDYLKDSSK